METQETTFIDGGLRRHPCGISPPHTHPGKEDVRAWMERRGKARLPPPAPAEIRRQLGWHVLPSDGAARREGA